MIKQIAAYLEEVRQIMRKLAVQEVKKVVDILLAAYDDGKTVFVMGNGGSAATANHLACDLAKGTSTPGGRRFKAVSLVDNVSLITAWANDTAYENIFAEQLANLVNERDVVLGISTSGDSQNILNAFELARKAGAKTVALVGFGGGKARGMVDYCFIVPSDNMQHVEDVHCILCHLIFACIRDAIAGTISR